MTKPTSKKTKKPSSKKQINEPEIPYELDTYSFTLPEIKFHSKKHHDIHKLFCDDSSQLILLDGVAGTGKTFNALYSALKLLKKEKVEGIIYIRKAVESSHDSLGFLPGTLSDKLENYMIPLVQKLNLFLQLPVIKKLIGDGIISKETVNYLRGVDWQNKCVIVDESQNLYYEEFKTLLTRIGEGCKIFVIGDTMQSDVGQKSGFKHILDIFAEAEAGHTDHGIFVDYLSEDDIVRSGICSHITKTFSKIDKLARRK